jgi:outer membrane protein assembly factor BamE (lipoprotein component of BamABCDE complex)
MRPEDGDTENPLMQSIVATGNGCDSIAPMRFHFACLSLLFAAIFTGCIGPAQRLEPKVVQQVKEGWKRPDVEKLLGEPRSTVVGNSGEKTVAHYGYTRRIDSVEFQLLGAMAKNPGDILTRHLSLVYNRQNVVDKVLFHQSITPFEVGFGRVSAGHTVSKETLDQVQKGVSTQDDVVKLLGEPTVRALDPEGDLGMIWHYGKSQMGWTKDRRDYQTLVVAFDKSGHVKERVLSGNVLSE